MVNKLSAAELLSLLNLEPNATCGFVRLTFVSDQSVAAGILARSRSSSKPRAPFAVGGLRHDNAGRNAASRRA